MKKRVITSTVAIVTLVFLLAGCLKEDVGSEPLQPDLQNRMIMLNMGGTIAFSTKSIGPVDKWKNTPVSVGYLFAPNTVFEKSLTVLVRDSMGTQVNTGMEYPDDNSEVSFIGYHPVATPNEVGTVTYDLSKGNVDVMVSNSVSGSLHNRIINEEQGIHKKLVFEHMLTRVTFKLQCAQGQTYPEPIYGLRASASSTKLLNTAVTFDLATENLTFKVAGGIFTGNLEGYVIPPYGSNPVVVDIMLQPGVPLKFTVSSLTGDRDIIINTDPNGLWTKLTSEGGERGKQYTVVLSFSGKMILAQNITITPWINYHNNLGGNQSWW